MSFFGIGKKKKAPEPEPVKVVEPEAPQKQKSFRGGFVTDNALSASGASGGRSVFLS